MTYVPLSPDELAERDTWPSILPQHLSASQLGMLERCPEQYRRRYVLGEKQRPGGALVWGQADHAAHEHNFGLKISTGEDLPVGDVQDVFAHTFDRIAENEDVDWKNDRPGELKDAGVGLVALYHRQVSPTLQPVAVEESFELALPGVPVNVIGRVDLRLADHVRERKTAKAKPSSPARHRLQGMIYNAALGLPVEWDYSVKTKTPAVYTADEIPALRVDGLAPLAGRYVTALAGQLLGLLETFGPDNIWPGALTNDWACNFCGWGPEGTNQCGWWR